MDEHQFDTESGTAPPGPGVVVDELRHATSVLAKTEWGDLPGEVIGEFVESFGSARNSFDGAEAALLDAYDRSGAWKGRGSRSCAHRAAYELRLPVTDVRRRLARGSGLRSMPATAAALAAGEITARHADRLIKANRAEVADQFAADEDHLIEQARRRPFNEWERLVGRWERLADPDDAEATADRQAADRTLRGAKDPSGVGRVEARLTPLGMAEFQAEHHRLEQKLFEADWADARARLGDKATAADLARTPAQRAADALLEMTRRSAACELDGAAMSARFVVNIHTDQTTLLESLAAITGVDPALLPDSLDDGLVTAAGRRFCETADGSPLAAGDMLLAALCGRVRRVLYDAEGRLIDHGRSQRLFTGSLRDAVIARSRTCTHPECDLPADRCEIDHLRSWEQDGHTNADNGGPACDHDNRWKARNPDLWRQVIDADRLRRRGSGRPDDPRMAPPTRRPDPPPRR